MTATEPAPRDHRPRSGSSARLFAGLVLVLVVVFAASSRDEAVWTAPDTTTSDTVEPPAPADPVAPTPPSTDEANRWLPDAGPVIEALAVVLFVAVVGAAALIVLRGTAGWSWSSLLRRRGRSRASSATPLPEAPRAVEADESEVFAALRDGPPRNAIVRCWMVLEQNAADAGMRREPAETSSEYVERVIGASSVDPQPIADLGALFREARFSSRPLDESRRADAEQALHRTLASLGGGTERGS